MSTPSDVSNRDAASKHHPEQVNQWPLHGNQGSISKNNGESSQPIYLNNSQTLVSNDRPQGHALASRSRSPDYEGRGYASDEYGDMNTGHDPQSLTTGPSRDNSQISQRPKQRMPTPLVPRINATIGPPPSSRRAKPSYYGNNAFVSPIPEESPYSSVYQPRPSHESYASSDVMPSEWIEDTPSYSHNNYEEAAHETIEEGRESRSTMNDDDDHGLIRSASLGKRSKPNMVTTRSSDRVQQTVKEEPANAAVAMGVGIPDVNPQNKTAIPAGQDNSASNAAQYFSTAGRSRSPGPNALSAIRRPPRLNLDAVRENEVRGSTTSLTDLIRRATKLASLIDRGKRPASRAGLNDFGDSRSELGGSRERRPQSSLSNMLSAFPPPGVISHDWATRPNPDLQSAKWEKDEQPSKKRRRRCCCLPLWGFLLLILLIFIVIAAAIVVPLELLVVHRIKPSTSSNNSFGLGACAGVSSTACQNGGTSILSNGNTCACVCTNGFTGPTCAVASTEGCVTISLPSSSTPTVVGNAIPRLIAGASNFSLTLDKATILERFGAANLSCITENALVTFDGAADRVGGGSDSVSSSSPSATPTAKKFRRDEITISLPSESVSPTSVLQDTSVVPASSSTTGTATTSTSTPTQSASSTSSSTTSFVPTQTTLDFARVVVLYVLQERALDAAVSAQASLQSFLNFGTDDNDGRNVTIGGGASVNLVNMTVVGVVR